MILMDLIPGAYYMCVYVMCLDIYNVAYDVGSMYMHVEESNLMSTIHW